ncbi:MAG TPA: DUF4236 domain-containing protein [Candidatus Krumholzibacteria bacterium]|nr:DUF4236 domain-containing protein [Candidatus Krumholzibacteria bacterium]
MGFYLRKAFKLGPLRLNLSQYGIGVSGGVTGARVGLMPGGRVYTHAGRYGLYHRRVWGRVGGRSEGDGGGATGAPAPPRVLRVDTGVTYGRDDTSTPDTVDLPLDTDGLDSGGISAPITLTLLLAAGAVLATVTEGTPVLLAVVCGAAALGGVVWTVRRISHRERLNDWLDVLEPLGDRPAREWPQQRTQIERLDVDRPLPADERRELARRAHLDLSLAAVLDGQVTDQELARLDGVSQLLDLDPAEVRTHRVHAYRAVHLEAVADRELDHDEEETLAHVRERLALEPDDLADENALADRLRRLRDLREGDPPVVEPDPTEQRYLRRGEVCHLRAPARLLRERVLERFQRDRQKHVVRGLSLYREGTLLITDRRLLLLGDRRTEIPLRAVVDCEVDLDRALITIRRSDRVRPIFLTTPDAEVAGALIARLAEL